MEKQTQTQTTSAKRNTLKIYAVGGCAINITIPYTMQEDVINDSFAKIDAVLIDTSRSNLIPGVPEHKFYHIEKASDGSGKNKAENYPIIKQEIPRILSKEGFEPADVNLVVFSTAGGTGGTAAHVLIDELLRSGETVVGLAIITHESAKSASNSYKTLIGLNNTAKNTGHPVVVRFIESVYDRLAADNLAKSFISELALLVSNKHIELDTKDIEHFIDFTRNNVTSVKPTLAAIECLVNPKHPEEIRHAITVAELHSSINAPLGLIRSEYACNGYPRKLTDADTGSYYYITTTKGVEELVERLKHEEEEALKNSRAQSTLNFDTDIKAEEDGILL